MSSSVGSSSLSSMSIEQSDSFQIPWDVPNVIGHSIDPHTKKIDHTEGFGAFDSILNNHYMGHRCIDVGGGGYDYNSAYCQHKYLIDLSVLDPFMRPDEHNRRVLDLARERPFDSCTSISVLNVINLEQSRMEHITLCKSLVRNCGRVFFKVWQGDGSGIERIKLDSFQSNRNLKSYMSEIQTVFGSKNVKFDEKNEIIIAVRDDP